MGFRNSGSGSWIALVAAFNLVGRESGGLCPLPPPAPTLLAFFAAYSSGVVNWAFIKAFGLSAASVSKTFV